MSSFALWTGLTTWFVPLQNIFLWFSYKTTKQSWILVAAVFCSFVCWLYTHYNTAHIPKHSWLKSQDKSCVCILWMTEWGLNLQSQWYLITRISLVIWLLNTMISLEWYQPLTCRLHHFPFQACYSGTLYYSQPPEHAMTWTEGGGCTRFERYSDNTELIQKIHWTSWDKLWKKDPEILFTLQMFDTWRRYIKL